MLIGSLFSPMVQESVEEQFKIQDFQGVVHSLKQMTFSGSPEDLSYLDNVFKFASFIKDGNLPAFIKTLDFLFTISSEVGNPKSDPAKLRILRESIISGGVADYILTVHISKTKETYAEACVSLNLTFDQLNKDRISS